MNIMQENNRMVEKNHSELVDKIIQDHNIQLERVQSNHMNLFSAAEILQENIGDNDDIYEPSDATLFDNYDTVVDQNLFDDSIDPKNFDGEVEVRENVDRMKEFENFDLSMLESEFNLEMLFDTSDSPTEDIVEETPKPKRKRTKKTNKTTNPEETVNPDN
jgi:hypothetical protein